MTECTRLSDRMAAVAHGRAAWSADEAAHLTSCGDCAVEWQVFQAGTLLGAEVARTLPADFLATRVVAALRSPGGTRPWWVRLRWLALPVAAAAAVVLMVRAGGNPQPTGVVPGAEVALLPELESLGATDLELVLELIPDPNDPAEIRGFDELSDDEMTRLLNALEG